MADDTNDVRPRTLDSAEFIEMYDRCYRPVFAYVARRLGPDAAEEITSQTFAEAWASRNRYDPDRGSPIVWCLGIATNLIKKHNRAEVKQLRIYAATGFDPLEPGGSGDGLAERAAARDDLRAVASALAGMDRVTRDVVYLWAAADLSYEEIADTLSIRIGTVRSKLSRARQKLNVVAGNREVIEGSAE